MAKFSHYIVGAFILLAPLPAFAGAVVNDPAFVASTLASNDDGSTGAINLGFAINYFGNTYSSTFVNNNGNVTFNAPLGTYTPFALTGGSVPPIIAPFFADVDTRGAGSGLTSYGTGSFNGSQTFGVTWPAVGYFGSHTDKLNTFQLLLVNRGDTGTGNFDIYFNYDHVLWETGDASGGSNGFGGSSVGAGYSAGTGAPGTFAQLDGSLVNGALIEGGSNSLVDNSNIGVAGRYLFTVRDGNVTVPVITGAAPEPATWGMMIGGFGMAGGALRRRRPTRTANA
jgi:hypothetical protein